jgi:hypothetical protein
MPSLRLFRRRQLPHKTIESGPLFQGNSTRFFIAGKSTFSPKYRIDSGPLRGYPIRPDNREKEAMAEKIIMFFAGFWKGFGSVLDLSGSWYVSIPPQIKTTRLPSVSDALESDWQKVGQDMQSAMDQFERDLHEQTVP